jgi:hypothetical protein
VAPALKQPPPARVRPASALTVVLEAAARQPWQLTVGAAAGLLALPLLRVVVMGAALLALGQLAAMLGVALTALPALAAVAMQALQYLGTRA